MATPIDQPLRIGSVGIGVIGGAMARRALTGGHRVMVHDVRSDAVDELAAAGALAAAAGRDLAAFSDFVVVSLPKQEDVDSAFTCSGGLLEALRQGAVVIETSTTPPAGLGALQKSIAGRGARLIDAPLCPSQNRDIVQRPEVSHGETSNAGGRAAESGNLCFFVGGEAADVAAARPVLDLLGVQAHHVGPLGAGKLVKLLHNAINLAALAAISESMIVARRSGLDIAGVIDALMTSLADSAMLRTQGRDFISAQRFPLGLFPLHFSEKDLGYALDCARAVGVEPSVTGAAHALFSKAAASSWREHYNPALFRFLEEQAEHGVPDKE